MSKKDEFKGFAKAHPELVSSIRSGDTDWQQLYEIYDIYGDDERAWNKYLKKPSSTSNFNNITDIVNSEEFNFISTLSKDKIEICKDCEFRYACKDCRPLGKSLDGNLWGKYAYCTYNPYIGRWQDVSGH